MKSLVESYKKTGHLHHAYVVEGDRSIALKDVYHFLENNLKIKTRANPDLYCNEFESFGIDTGRVLQAEALRKTTLGDRKVFVITILSITGEAQNSLLKLFEEPREGVHFFIIVSSSEMFLPTVRSRFQILHTGVTENREKTLADEFVVMSKKNRLKLLKGIIEDKDKEKALCFLNDLEVILYNKKSKGYPWTQDNINVFKMIQRSRDYLRGRAPSLKMILEHISLGV